MAHSIANNNDLIMLNEFIDSNLSDTIDYDLALEELLKLSLFIEENLLAINRSTIYDIVMDNRILNSILETIVQNIKDYQDLDTVSADVNDNEIAFLLLRAYLMQNNLIAKEMEDYIDHTESDYYQTNKESKLESIELSGKTVRKLRKMLLTDKEKTTELIIRYYAKVIEKKLPSHGNYNELYQEGCLAIMEAINHFLKSNKLLATYIYVAISTYFRDYNNRMSKAFEPFDDIDENDVPNILTSLKDEPFEDVIINEPPFKLEELVQQINIPDYNRELLIYYFNSDIEGSKLYEPYNTSRQNFYARINHSLRHFLSDKTIIESISYLDDPDKALQTIKENINVVDLTVSWLHHDFANIVAQVPLTNLEREILCYYYELNGYQRKNDMEMAQMYGINYLKLARTRINAMYKIISQRVIPYMDLVPELDKKIKEYGKSYR